MENVVELLNYLPLEDIEVNDYVRLLIHSAQVTSFSMIVSDVM